MFDQTGVITQVLEKGESFSDMNAFGSIAAIFILATASVLFIYIYKKFREIKNHVTSNGHSSKDEIIRVHQRLDEVFKLLAEQGADIAFIKGRMSANVVTENKKTD